MTPDIEKQQELFKDLNMINTGKKENRKTRWIKIIIVIVLQNSKNEKAAMENWNIFGVLKQFYGVKDWCLYL